MLNHSLQTPKVQHLLRLIRQQQSSGFTLIEVIVAILILSLFTNAAMTGLTVATMLKVRARVESEATTWIQQDLEAVRSQSSQISYQLATSADVGQPYITLSSTTGLVPNEEITIGSSSMVYTIHSISGNTVRLTTNLSITHPAASLVYNITKCNATVPQTGFAYTLQQTLPPIQDSGSRSIAGKTYTLTRNGVIAGTAPYEVLQLSYTVQTSSSTTPTATMYTEVIPNVAFQCPRAQ